LATLGFLWSFDSVRVDCLVACLYSSLSTSAARGYPPLKMVIAGIPVGMSMFKGLQIWNRVVSRDSIDTINFIKSLETNNTVSNLINTINDTIWFSIL